MYPLFTYCSKPLEVLARYASPEQQEKWLVPLLNGEIRSAFAMTERFGMYIILCNPLLARVAELLLSCFLGCHQHQDLYSSRG